MGATAPSAFNLANELRAATRAAKILGCEEAKKLGEYDRIDFALFRSGRIVGWAEVKCRSCAHNDHSDFYVSLDKVDALVRTQVLTGTPAYLIVGWSDCLGIMTFPVAAAYYDINGRRDRGRSKDIEPVAHFPISAFRLCKWESRQ